MNCSYCEKELSDSDDKLIECVECEESNNAETFGIITALEEENKAFREALGFYAKGASWEGSKIRETEKDCDSKGVEFSRFWLFSGGKRAREVLAKYPEGDE